jgi:hypothetical protein
MDRYTVNTAKSQIGFIDVIAGPTFEVVKNFVPIFNEYFCNLENNKNLWKTKIEFYEDELSKNFLDCTFFINYLFILEKLNEFKSSKTEKNSP